MKVLLDIADDKASSLMEVLNGLPYVTIEEIDEIEQHIGEIKEAVEELNLITAGKKEVRDLDEFLNEL